MPLVTAKILNLEMCIVGTHKGNGEGEAPMQRHKQGQTTCYQAAAVLYHLSKVGVNCSLYHQFHTLGYRYQAV
jgi:hypothetical protein